MMVLPSKEERNMSKTLEKWLRMEDDTDYFYLDPTAPDDIKRTYEEYRTKYLGKDGLWRPLD
ncbi:hypothetical protein SAMN04487934_11626 [Eubacterium ruminantium]|nr:hypothetical protein SAMN04487934_11626 [Eubacterium ruminantium]